MKNMKLSYIYKEEMNGEKIEINLDNEFNFQWNNKSLKINKKTNYIKNFYGKNISNFNLIIGKNGAGKTTMLNKIIDLTHTLQGKMIKIMKIDNSYHIFYFKNFHVNKDNIIYEGNLDELGLKFCEYEIDEHGIEKIDKHSVHYKEVENKNSNYQSIFFTNQFSKSSYDGERISEGIYHPYNSGLRHLLMFPKKMFKNVTEENNIINIYDSYFNYILAKFYYEKNCDKLLEKFEIDRPDKIVIIDTSLYQVEQTLFNLDKYYKEKNEDIVRLDKVSNRIKEADFKFNKENILFFSMIENFIENIHSVMYNGKIKTDKNYEHILKRTSFEWLNGIDINESTIQYYIDRFEELKQKYVELINDAEDLDTESFYAINVKTIEKHIRLFNLIKQHGVKLEFRNVGNIRIYMNINKNLIVIKKILFEIANTIRNNPKYFKFGWCKSNGDVIKLSSGQEQILSMFSRISFAYEELKQIPIFEKLDGITKKEISNIIITLDEPDTYLHPEWHRRLLKWLFEYIKSKFESINVQLIITTNSPILAGDVLKKDIVFLGENKGNSIEETFSRNLLSLFKETFSMDSLIGEFSSGKIKDLIGEVKKGQREKREEQLKLINMIGEPVIKRKISLLYESVYKNEPKRSDIEFVRRGIRLELDDNTISKLTGWSIEDIRKVKLE